MAALTNGLSLLQFEKDIALNHEEKKNSISPSAYGLFFIYDFSKAVLYRRALK